MQCEIGVRNKEQVDDKAQDAFFVAHLFVDMRPFRATCLPVPSY